MRMELIVRFDYGSIVPWVRSIDGMWRAIGGPDAVSLWSPVPNFTERISPPRRASPFARESALQFLLDLASVARGSANSRLAQSRPSSTPASGGSNGASSALTRGSGATTSCVR